MSRKEDFIEAGIQNHIHHCPQMMLRGGYAYAGDKEKLRSKIFEEGAEYGYQYAVDKACEWMRDHLGAPAGIPQAKSYNDAINELITEFRKGMEE